MLKLFTRKDKNQKGNEAAQIMQEPDRLERFLQRVEKRLKLIPRAGRRLATIPMMISLLNSYYKKEYRHIPIGSIIAMMMSLIYFLSPIDVIPDFIPFVGFLDDAVVVATVWKLIDSDVNEYRKWQQAHGKILT